MSDLISRSKLINDIATYFFGDKCNLDRLGRDLREIINNQPTVYDIDKVVGELETNKQNALEVEESIKEYNVWNEAIEIVKAGGIDE